jgi:hypothetical protein
MRETMNSQQSYIGEDKCQSSAEFAKLLQVLVEKGYATRDTSVEGRPEKNLPSKLPDNFPFNE